MTLYGDERPLERALVALALVLSCVLIVLICYRPTGTIDLWWTLKVGDHIRETGDVPRTALWTMDVLSDLPYVCHSWLAALVYSSVAAAFGIDAIPSVPTLVAFATFALVILLCRQQGASWPFAVAVAALALWVVILRMIGRAEVFGYLYFALALNAVAAFARTRRARYLAALVPLSVLWINTHGSALILLALLPLVAAGLALDAWRREAHARDALRALLSRESAWLLATWLLAAAATLITPYGADLIGRIVNPFTSSLMRQAVEEWKPLYALAQFPLRFAVPFALVAASLVAGFQRLSAVSVLLALSFAGLAFSATRHLPYFGLAAAYLLGDFASGIALGARRRTALAAALVAVLAAGTAFTVASLGIQNRSLLRNPSPWMSERGLEFVRRHVSGNVLNRWQLGGLLIYFAHPQVRVAIDSRIDPYPTDYILSYQRALYGSAADTLAFVDRYAIDHILLDRAFFETEFRRKLARLDGFRVAFMDPRSVVLSRKREGRGGGPARRSPGPETAHDPATPTPLPKFAKLTPSGDHEHDEHLPARIAQGPRGRAGIAAVLALQAFPLLAFYVEHDDRIDVWCVLHDQRDVPAWLRQSERDGEG